MDRIVEDTIELSRIPGPSYEEGERIGWLERRLAVAPGRRWRDEVGNLIWGWGDAPPQLVATAHVDTVFPGETPLDIGVSDGVLRGPGVGDNGVGVAVSIAVLERLLGTDELRPGALAFTRGEEGLGNLFGARAVVRAMRPPALLAIEGLGQEVLVADTLGSVRAKVSVDGPGGHSWSDRGSASAIAALLQLGHEVLRLATDGTPVNIGLISGGRSVNTIAPHAEMLVEMRALDQAPLAAFRTSLERLSVEAPLRVAVEIAGERGAGRLSRGSYLLAAVRATRAELGLPDGEVVWSTDANAAIAEGIPAIALGLCEGRGMHTPDDQVRLDSIPVGASLLAGVLLRLIGRVEG